MCIKSANLLNSLAHDQLQMIAINFNSRAWADSAVNVDTVSYWFDHLRARGLFAVQLTYVLCFAYAHRADAFHDQQVSFVLQISLHPAAVLRGSTHRLHRSLDLISSAEIGFCLLVEAQPRILACQIEGPTHHRKLILHDRSSLLV